MIDGVRLRINLTEAEAIAFRAKLDWNITFESHDGELGPVIRTRKLYRKLFWDIKTTKKGIVLIVDGSLNKFLNGTNTKNLTLSRLSMSVTEISQFIGVSPHRIQVVHLEIGFGIRTSVSPKDIVRNTIMMNGETPNLIKSDKDGDYILFKKDEFQVKEYDRGVWLKDGSFQLAIELRGIKVRFIRSLGIHSLADFNVSNLMIASKKLLDVIKSFLIFDPRVDISKLSGKQQIFMFQCLSGEEWVKIKKSGTRLYRRRKFQKIMSDQIGLTIHEEICRTMTSEVLAFFNR